MGDFTSHNLDERHENRQAGWTDMFGNQVGTRTNVLDLAAHYHYSPERWRLFVDGARAFPEYNAVSQYNHDTDAHDLQPAAGETVVLESAERPRYVVQYELSSTFAFVLNQSLSDGDSIKIGSYDGSNGWYLEQIGSKHTDTEADFVNERGGTEQYRKENIDIHKATTTFARLKLKTGWYNITRQEWERSYSNDGEQETPEIGSFSYDTGRGPEVGNLPIHFEVTADANTTGLVLEAGSAAQVNLGKTTALTRTKTAPETATISTTGTYVPLFALRNVDNHKVTNVQLTDVAIREFSGNADITVIAVACDPSKVLDGAGNQLTDADYSAPPELSEYNNVIQRSTAVEQFPDSTGTVGTSATNPGGFQTGHDSLYTGGGNTVTESTGITAQAKRSIYPRDIIVFLAKAGGTGDVTVEYRTSQDW